MNSKKWLSFKNILCVRLDNMGDVLMTSPALRALKEGNKKRKITLLTSGSGAAIAKYIPIVDSILLFDAPWVKNATSVTDNKKLFGLIKELAKREFDAAVIFTNFSQNPLSAAMLLYLAGIQNVLGYCRENPYHLLSDWVPDKEPFDFISHGVTRQLQLVKEAGADIQDDSLLLTIPASSKEKVKRKLRQMDVKDNKPIIIVHAGASEEKRRYPAKYFAKAADTLITKYHCQIILTGTSEEKKIADTISKTINKGIYNLTGQLSLDELIALIDIADIVISNNTGPVHIAAAVKTPVVVLYAITNPEHTPWKVPNSVLYFDVPENLKSKNQVLQILELENKIPMPLPDDIVDAVTNFL